MVVGINNSLESLDQGADRPRVHDNPKVFWQTHVHQPCVGTRQNPAPPGQPLSQDQAETLNERRQDQSVRHLHVAAQFLLGKATDEADIRYVPSEIRDLRVQTRSDYGQIGIFQTCPTPSFNEDMQTLAGNPLSHEQE